MGLYGQFPGGGFAGDENCRPGYTDPRQGFETCGIVEFMHSFEMLTKISGNPLWADRCEDIAFNSFPAALTPDLKGLHYLTCANQVQLDKENKAPAIQNDGTMFSYSPLRACIAAASTTSRTAGRITPRNSGWPRRTAACAPPSTPPAKSARRWATGASVKIAEETDYPFGDTVSSRSPLRSRCRFPLYLRIPRWCADASAKINGKVGSLHRQAALLRGPRTRMEGRRHGDACGCRCRSPCRNGRRTTTRSR